MGLPPRLQTASCTRRQRARWPGTHHGGRGRGCGGGRPQARVDALLQSAVLPPRLVTAPKLSTQQAQAGPHCPGGTGMGMGHMQHTWAPQASSPDSPCSGSQGTLVGHGAQPHGQEAPFSPRGLCFFLWPRLCSWDRLLGAAAGQGAGPPRNPLAPTSQPASAHGLGRGSSVFRSQGSAAGWPLCGRPWPWPLYLRTAVVSAAPLQGWGGSPRTQVWPC